MGIKLFHLGNLIIQVGASFGLWWIKADDFKSTRLISLELIQLGRYLIGIEFTLLWFTIMIGWMK